MNITDSNELFDTETLFFEKAYEYYLKQLELNEIDFDVDLLFQIHRYIFSLLYEWAGELRKVNLSKEGMMFAAAQFLPQSVQSFKDQLDHFLLKLNCGNQELAKGLALIHNEFNSIHPFREGNGRTIRLFLDLLAVHQGYDLIDYTQAGQEAYFQACIEGVKGDHKPMEKVILKG